jgi:hypothetical protein
MAATRTAATAMNASSPRAPDPPSDEDESCGAGVAVAVPWLVMETVTVGATEGGAVAAGVEAEADGNAAVAVSAAVGTACWAGEAVAVGMLVAACVAGWAAPPRGGCPQTDSKVIAGGAGALFGPPGPQRQAWRSPSRARCCV